METEKFDTKSKMDNLKKVEVPLLTSYRCKKRGHIQSQQKGQSLV